jgi:hypothetical protein
MQVSGRCSFVLGLVLVLLYGAAFAQDPPLDSPEQKVLDKWVGQWKTTYTAPKAEWTPEERTGSADLSIRRAVGGRFVEEVGKHADGTEGRLLMTYDGLRMAYRSWWFSSQGFASESKGVWDAKTGTMNWTTEQDGFVTTVKFHFTDADHAEWDVLTKDGSGKTMFLMNGKSVRVKE